MVARDNRSQWRASRRGGTGSDSPPEGLDASTITPLGAIYRRARQLGEVHTNPTSGVSVPAVNRRQTRFATAPAARGDARPSRRARRTMRFGRPPCTQGELMALHREEADLATGVIGVERGMNQRGRCCRSPSRARGPQRRAEQRRWTTSRSGGLTPTSTTRTERTPLPERLAPPEAGPSAWHVIASVAACRLS